MNRGATDGGPDGGAWRVRAPRPADASALGVLHNLVWRQAYAGLMSQAYLDARDDAAAGERWAATIDALDDEGWSAGGRRTLVAVAGSSHGASSEELVGFITAGPARRDEHRGMAELMALYVHPSRYGAGVAQALVGSVDLAGPAMLWVLDGNHRAMQFYTKIGFELRDDLLVHEPTGTSERLMVRPG